MCKIICVFRGRERERDLLNYLQAELSNWYQVFKWGQMLQCSFMQFLSCIKSVSLHLMLECFCFIGLEPLNAVFSWAAALYEYNYFTMSLYINSFL